MWASNYDVHVRACVRESRSGANQKDSFSVNILSADSDKGYW